MRRWKTTRPTGSRWTTASAYGLLALAIIAPQLLGGATDETALAVLTLSACTCGLAAVAAHLVTRRPDLAPAAALAGWLAIAWTLVQALPLPCALVDLIQPQLARRLDELTALGAVTSSDCSISVAPGATFVTLAITAMMAALMLAAVTVARLGHRKLLVTGIALSSAVMAAVAVAHSVSAASSIFGIYTPGVRPGMLLAPLLNANHLAGHLALGFPLCIAFALSSRRLDARIVWWGLSFLVLTTGLLTLSRGGAVALLTGGGGYLLIHVLKNTSAGRTRVRLMVSLSAAILCTGFAAYFALDLLTREFEQQQAPFYKLTVFAKVLKLGVQHFWFGVGRGAIRDVTPNVVDVNMQVLYAENLPIQWLVEWGAPATAAIVALLLLSAFRVRLRRTDRALAIGLLALLCHNLVDFSLELPGVACVAAIAAGTLLGREQERPGQRAFGRYSLRDSTTVGAALAALSLGIAVPFLTTNSRARFHVQLQDLLGQSGGDFEEILARALRWYPMDPSLTVMGTARAVREGAKRAGAWLNLAMQDAPGWASPHIHAAYALERQGLVGQAAGELSLAFEKDVPVSAPAACEMLRRHPQAALARQMVPRLGHQIVAEHLARCLVASGQRAQAETFLSWLIAKHPTSEPARGMLVELALEEEHVDVALSRARELLSRAPQSALGNALFMRVQSRSGKPVDALRAFDAASESVRRDKLVLLEALHAAAAAQDEARIASLSGDLFGRHGARAEDRASLHFSISLAFETAGNLGKALTHAQRSYEESGSLPSLERVHGLARRSGMLQVALRAATELCHLRHGGDAYCTR